MKFKYVEKMTEKEIDEKFSTIWLDKGEEFTYVESKQYCDDHDIKKQLVQMFTPKQNGVVKRHIWTIIEHAQNMIVGCKLLNYLWSETINIQWTF
jgi:hypothetical protein